MMESCSMLCYSDSTTAVLSLVSAKVSDTPIDREDSDAVSQDLTSI